jgi:hypothetical protein
MPLWSSVLSRQSAHLPYRSTFGGCCLAQCLLVLGMSVRLDAGDISLLTGSVFRLGNRGVYCHIISVSLAVLGWIVSVIMCEFQETHHVIWFGPQPICWW